MEGIPLTVPLIAITADARVIYKDTTFYALQGNILKLTLDALFNPTRKTLVGSVEIPGFEHEAGVAHFERVTRLCAERSFRQGECCITSGYDLPYKCVVMCVFPDCRFQPPDLTLLRACVRRGILTALDAGMRSISFPMCGSGLLKWDIHESVSVIIDTVLRLARVGKCCEHVVFCDNNASVVKLVSDELKQAVFNFEGVDAYALLDSHMGDDPR